MPHSLLSRLAAACFFSGRVVLLAAGLWTSSLFAQNAPAFTATPTPRQVVAFGDSLTLTVAAGGSPAPVITWTRNGLPLPGATGPSLTLTAATMRDAGWYRATATNSAGSASSPVVFVNVAVPRPEILVRRHSTVVDDFSPDRIASLLDVPRGLSRISAIAAGRENSFALRDDGTVVAWGTGPAAARQVPSDLTDVVALSVGPDRNLALRADGRVVAWGADENGEATPPASLSNVVAIAIAGTGGLALRADGRVVGWGSSASGATSAPSALTDAVAIAPGLALRANGTVVAWGGTADRAVPAGLGGVVAIGVGTGFATALKNDGTLTEWITSTGTNNALSGRRPLNPITGLVTLSVNTTLCTGLRADGTAVEWTNEVGFGAGGVSAGVIPGPDLGPALSTLTNVVAISAGSGHFLFLRETSRDIAPAIVTQPVGQFISAASDTGTITPLLVVATGSPAPNYQWHRNGVPLPGQTQSTLYSITTGTYTVTVTNPAGTVTSSPASVAVLTPPAISAPSPARQRVALGSSLRLATTVTSSDAARLQWTRNGLPIPGATSADYTLPQATTRDTGAYQLIASNSVGTTRSAVVFVNVAVPAARLAAWGDPAVVQTLPATLSDVVAVVPINTGTYVLQGDGTVSAWGAAEAPPAGLRDVVALSAGATNALALKSDGSVVAWGSAGTTPPTTEKDVVGIKVSGNRAGDRSVVIRADGSIAGGLGAIPADFSPTTAIAFSRSQSIGLRGDGSIRDFAQLFAASIPAPAVNIRAIAAGTDHFAVLTRDGGVILWGDNSAGQVTAPSGLTGVVGLDATGNYTVALRGDGTVLAWGEATTGLTSVPPGLNRAVAVAAGQKHCVALIDASPATAPVLTTSPVAQTVAPGGSATFTATLAGSATGLTYQWLFNGEPLPGATAAALTLNDVAPAAAGRYAVRIANALGSVTSDAATLTVDLTRNPGRLINLAVRAAAGSGARTLIVGVTVGGGTASGGAKPLLVRAVGPSLSPFGVTGFLADPALRVYSGQTVAANNDNWGGDTYLTRVSADLGAFALGSRGSRDAAMAIQLGTGGHTVQITGADGGDGIALAELYDASTPGTHSPDSPRLLNLAARAQVSTGGNILIAGFVVGGLTEKTVLIRGVGPALVGLGIADALADPKLDLFSGSTVIRSNDNWSGSGESAAATRVGAFPLGIGSKDAVLLVTLPPGAYSAQVSSVGATTGVALVEVYDVP